MVTRDGVQADRPADPCALVIFGASGDLTKRKLMPALYNLAESRLLPREFAVVGVASTSLSSEEFRERLSQDVAELMGGVQAELWGRLKEATHYLAGDFKSPETYDRLKELLARVDKERGVGGNYLFYLATPPDFFGEITERLGAAGLTDEGSGAWRRVIFEKPFGHDLESARELNLRIGGVLRERQIYRIDHYLGKETVQNVLVFRFANGIFEPIWNRRYIDHVQITVGETVGVEQRAGYYERSGALRDMVPNHLLQLVALIAMEPPTSFQADAVRNEKAKVIQAVRPLSNEDVLTRTVRGQYGEGRVGPDRMPAYRSEPGVDPRSNTETYVAMKLLIDNWRWADVPFYLRTGKRLAKRDTEIVIQFKRPPQVLFRGTPAENVPPNLLVLQIQPEEGINLCFQAKVPGPVVRTGQVDMTFNYAGRFGSAPSTGYETLLFDCMCGDATLFQRADSIEAGWAVVTPALDVWRAIPPRGFPNYAAGSWGPAEADELLARDGRAWQDVRS